VRDSAEVAGRCCRDADAESLPEPPLREHDARMTDSDTPCSRVRKLPKQFRPLQAWDAERRRGLVYTPEYDGEMGRLEEEFRRWLLGQ
jgi:hypothetical protein